MQQNSLKTTTDHYGET